MFRASLPLLRPLTKTTSFARASPLLQRQALPRPRQCQSPIALDRQHQQARFLASKSDKDNEDPPPPKRPIDHEHEKELAQRKLEADPSKVTIDSSRRRIIDGTPKSPGATGEPSLEAGLKGDIELVKDTFRLESVPYESRVLGLAGTLPYLATSLSTVFLTWNVSQTLPTGNSLLNTVLFDHDTAHRLLEMIEPIQVGYGAIIISFLGAIHWGLEYAETKPSFNRTRFRYGMGLAASVVAWPTLLMPIHYALTSQFAAFTALYFADSRAARYGWAPRWYGMYRFLLTAMVGFAIFISLVGRTSLTRQKQLGKEAMAHRLQQPGLADHETDWTKLEDEERQRNRKKKEAQEKAKKEAEAEQKAKEKKEKSKKKPQAKEDGSDKKAESESKGAKDEEDKENKDEGKEEKKDDKRDDKDEDKEKTEEKKDEGNEDKKDDKDEGEEKTEKDDDSKDKKQAEDKGDDKSKDKDSGKE